MIDNELKAVFKQEGPFSWSKWWGEGYPLFKQLLKQRQATFESDVVNEGRCIDCTARVAIYNLSVRFENRYIELMRYRDPCGCSTGRRL